MNEEVAALKDALAIERANGLVIVVELAVARAKASEDEALIARHKLQSAKLRHRTTANGQSDRTT